MTAKDVESFMLRFKIIIAGALAVLVLPIVVYGFYLDQRLDSFESKLELSPPHELEEDHAAHVELSEHQISPVTGQLVYVPAYSHIYHGDGKPYLLTITLSVRNTSIDKEIIVKSIRYFDTKGREVKAYLKKPVRLPSLGTTEIVIDRNDSTGGSGANFLVEWYAKSKVSQPIIEAVMIDTNSQQGISFVRAGSVISEMGSDVAE
jgi:hypothetical protein